MNILYSRLFEVDIHHDFFASGQGKDLELYPSQETERLLKQGRMLWRKTPKGIVVLYRTENDLSTPEVALSQPIRFNFLIQCKNPAFFQNITDLDQENRKFKTGDFLFFQNDPENPSFDSNQPELINHQLVDGFRPKAFQFNLKLQSNPQRAIFRVTDSEGNLISAGKTTEGLELPLNQELQPDDTGVFLVRVNLSGKQEGLYTLQLRNEGDTEDLWKKTYFLTAQNDVGIGLASFHYPEIANSLYGDREFYALQFKRKSTRWTYYIVSQNNKVDLATAQLSILDKGNPPESPYETYAFQQLGSAPHSDIKISDHDTVIFRSQVPIPFFEFPKLNLELRRKPGNRVLFAHLPNPNRSGITKQVEGESESEIFIYL